MTAVSPDVGERCVPVQVLGRCDVTSAAGGLMLVVICNRAPVGEDRLEPGTISLYIRGKLSSQICCELILGMKPKRWRYKLQMFVTLYLSLLGHVK